MFGSIVLPDLAVQGRTRSKRKSRNGSVFLKLKLLQAWRIFAFSFCFVFDCTFCTSVYGRRVATQDRT